MKEERSIRSVQMLGVHVADRFPPGLGAELPSAAVSWAAGEAGKGEPPGLAGHQGLAWGHLAAGLVRRATSPQHFPAVRELSSSPSSAG